MRGRVWGGGEGGAIGGAECITAHVVGNGKQGFFWVGDLFVRASAENFHRPDGVFGEQHEAGIVRDSSRNESISGIYECWRQQRAHRQRRRRDGILNVTEDRIDRQSHIVRTDLALQGIACGAAEACSKRRFRAGPERTYIPCIFEE